MARVAGPAIDAAGTTVAFQSAATNPAAPGPRQRNLPRQPRVRKGDARGRGRRRRLASRREHVTGDQRRRPLVVFASKADLTCTARGPCAGDNSVADVYVRDTRTNVTRRISRSVSGGEPNGASYDPAISGNGRYVAFVSEASNLTRDPGPSRRPDLRPRPDQRHDGTHQPHARRHTGKRQQPAARDVRRRPANRLPVPCRGSDLRREVQGRTGRHQPAVGCLPSRPPDRGHHPREPRQRRRLDEYSRAPSLDASGASSYSSRVIRSTTGTTGTMRIY